MEKPPEFLTEFTKEESPKERQETAKKIKAKRAEYFDQKKVLDEQLEVIEKLKEKLAELNTSGLDKLKNYFQIRKLRVDLTTGEEKRDELKGREEETQPALQEARQMLDNFYENQKRKWAKSEYTKEDITNYFFEEHLASLSLEDYSLLLKRFPGQMVAHVTRQGIRDHTGHMYHTAGEGAFTDGFMKIVEDGRLRSPLSVHLIEDEKEEAIARYLNLGKARDKGEVLKFLGRLTDNSGTGQGDGGSYADRMAIHFAAEEVADSYYGSEKGNEIFVAYPSAHVASQYFFRGQLNQDGGGYWNDQWVWANEEKGMDLNAGLVFIPKEAKVGKETGSRYELDEYKNPIENAEFQQAMRKMVDSPDFDNFADQVVEIILANKNNQELLNKLEPLRQKIEKGFGITDSRLQSALLSYNSMNHLKLQKKTEQEGKRDPFNSIEEEIKRILEDAGLLYKEASETISSQEFWESYFARDPTKRPSKIVYYEGSDPTEALRDWRTHYGGRRANKFWNEGHMGFPEKQVATNSPEATAGLDRFRSLAEKVIEDYFAEK